MDSLAVLGLVIGASAIAVTVAVLRLLRRGPGVPPPWELRDPFRRTRR